LEDWQICLVLVNYIQIKYGLKKDIT
jgi:hypothetical protein